MLTSGEDISINKEHNDEVRRHATPSSQARVFAAQIVVTERTHRY